MAKPPNSHSDRDLCACNTNDVLLALARLLGRQAAREAFQTAHADASSSDTTETPSPATPTDEE